MKCIVLLLILAPFFAGAQNKPLVVEGTAPGFYITHTVAAKENYYSIGRMYNISPKEIAPFNNLQLEKGLSLNQVVKVPLLAGNFSQDGIVAADEVLVPVYHTVKEKEGLYRIGVNYNKVSVETLKQWNGIKGDAVPNGTKLIVGYLKVKKELSPLSGMAKPVTPVVNAAPAKDPGKPDVSNETLPVVKNPEKKTGPAPVKKEDSVVVKKDDKPAPAPVVKKEEPVVKKEDKPAVVVKKEEPQVVKKEDKPAVIIETPKGRVPGGFFKSLYNDQARGGDNTSETGTAAVFKSTSGWDDSKYYCLYNSATPGTILKITANGKSVYAKVLDVMPDIKQNAGVMIRLSNAAAAELGIEEQKFDCTVNYTK